MPPKTRFIIKKQVVSSSVLTYYKQVDLNVRKILEKINISGEVKTAEPMSVHTTFKTGGNADLYVRPASEEDLLTILEACRRYRVPFFILGGGANILVSDGGIEGCVIDMGELNSVSFKGTVCMAESGSRISDAAERAAEKNLSGLDFIYAMPGSTGGAVWMNARCYGTSISDILHRVRYIDENLKIRYLERDDIRSSFSYKKSFFQGTGNIILSAEFLLKEGSRIDIQKNMRNHELDRNKKGHFLYPSAGSVFKNNRDFGRPTGVILDSLGLKGKSVGDARVADFHGNIIVNNGRASSKDVKDLIDVCYTEAKMKLGIELECEIQFIGRW